jgi:hypothetical protein
MYPSTSANKPHTDAKKHRLTPLRPGPDDRIAISSGRGSDTKKRPYPSPCLEVSWTKAGNLGGDASLLFCGSWKLRRLCLCHHWRLYAGLGVGPMISWSVTRVQVAGCFACRHTRSCAWLGLWIHSESSDWGTRLTLEMQASSCTP